MKRYDFQLAKIWNIKDITKNEFLKCSRCGGKDFIFIKDDYYCYDCSMLLIFPEFKEGVEE